MIFAIIILKKFYCDFRMFRKKFLSNKTKNGIISKEMIQIQKDINDKYQEKSCNSLKIRKDY